MIGSLIVSNIELNEIMTSSVFDENKWKEEKQISSHLPLMWMCIEKANFCDAEVSEHHRQLFKKFCQEYKDVSSSESSDMGKTTLITMGISTGYSPPVSMKPHTPSFKTCNMGTARIGKT